MTKRPRLVVAAWILLVAVLGFLGRDIDRKLGSELPYVEGTAAKRAHDIAVREFGGEDGMIVMLRGPGSAVGAQGRRLAKRLNAAPRTEVISPWSGEGAIDGLRPRPAVAALVVRVGRREGEPVADLLPPVRQRTDRVVSAPVRASIAGLPAIATSYRNASEEAAKTGELIALPVLLIVLLLVFRSVLAAMMPVLAGAAVVVASRGVLALLNDFLIIDLFSLGVAAMLGLALGVDYSLLVVSRFREERKHADVADAARATVARTARSIVPAGCGLVLAMLVAILLFPNTTMTSIALAVIAVSVLSVISAMCVVPALLTLIGPHLDRWSLPQGRPRGAALRWSRRLSARPRAVAAIAIGMVLCAAWAFTLDTGIAAAGLLPSDDRGRIEQEDIERELGPGWVASMEVVVVGRDGPLTSPGKLRSLERFQRQVESDPGIAAVAGFAELASGARQLNGIEGSLAQQQDGLERLGSGLSRLRDGAALNTEGLLAAAAGARALDAGAGAATGGAGLLADSLRAARSGSERLSEGLGRAGEGSGELAEGAAEASSGAARLASGLDRAAEEAGEIGGSARLLENAMRSGSERLAEARGPLAATGDRLGAAWQALQAMTEGRGDPQYEAAVQAVEAARRHLDGTDLRSGEQSQEGLDGVASGIERAEGQFDVGLYLAGKLDEGGEKAQEGIERLAKGSERLDRGLRRLAAGSRQVSDGIDELARGGERLPPSLQRLSEGAGRLAGGLERLQSGTGHLAGGLGGGAQESKLLTGGLQRIGSGVERRRAGGTSQLERLQAQSPDFFRSGYLVLAGLDGSRPRRREQIASLVNLDRGGQVARLLLIPRASPSGPRAGNIMERVERDADELADETGAEVLVGGAAPNQIEIDREFREQSVLLRAALALVTFLVLVPVVRSLLLPAIAALLNVLVVSASLGILALLFDTSLLGGPGFVDVSVIAMTVVVIFGLAIDYEVFVFARIREEYVRSGSTKAAIANGLDHSAPVVTGAAVIMIAVFLAFAVSDFMVMRNFGVALAIAVFLDAFVVRLIVIPAMMRLLGRWNWWMPGWLDRLLPGGGPVAAAKAA